MKWSPADYRKMAEEFRKAGDDVRKAIKQFTEFGGPFSHCFWGPVQDF